MSLQDTTSDAVLARRVLVAGGEGVAEAELCRRFARRALLYGLRHLKNSAAAEDLAQEALVTMLLALREGKLRDPEQIASFVLGTCRTLAIAQGRTARRRDELLAREPLQLAVAEHSHQIDHARLRGCIERLSERERSIIMLTFQQETSVEVIARTLGLTAGNVRVLRHRTLARLHVCIENTGAVP